jgi:hypothetical protein
MGDIFSNDPAVTAPLDTSDIDERWEPVTDDAVTAVNEHDAEVEAEDAAVAEVDEVDDSDEAEVDEVDEAPAADEPEAFAIPDHLSGKTPEELAKIVVDSQRQIGSQSGEVAELRRITEQQAGQLRELIDYLQEVGQQAAAPQVDTEGVVSQAVDNPQAAYQQAVQLVDAGHATPDLVDEVIAAVEDMNPRLARLMDRDFQRRMIVAELRGEMEQTIEKTFTPLAKNDYQSQVNLATSSLYSDPVLGEDAKAYEQEVVALLKGQRLGSDAREIRARLEAALTVARGNDPTKSAAYKKAVAQLKTDAQVEAGNPPAAPEKKSEADEYRERAFKRAAERDPGAALFA